MNKIKNCSDVELLEFAKTIQSKSPLILFEQDLTQNDFVNVMKRFGKCEQATMWMNPKEYPEIFIVTPKRDDQNNSLGMFGDYELGWHIDGDTRTKVKEILLGLYCEISCEDTTLSMINTTSVFNDFTETEKDYYRNIKCLYKYKENTSLKLPKDSPELKIMDKHQGEIKPIVGIHPHTNTEYFYCSFNSISKVWYNEQSIDTNEFIDDLYKKVVRSKYITHHIMHEGDLVLMDQLTTLHRRTKVTNPNRTLWRIASDYDNVMSLSNNF